MTEWRGVVIQLALIASLTAIVIKAADGMVLHSAVGILGAAMGTAVARSRSEAAGKIGGGKNGGSGVSIPPILGAMIGGVLAIAIFVGLAGCAATPSAEQQSRVAAYSLEMNACVAAAVAADSGPGSSLPCREGVMRRYGRLDGGTE